MLGGACAAVLGFNTCWCTLACISATETWSMVLGQGSIGMAAPDITRACSTQGALGGAALRFPDNGGLLSRHGAGPARCMPSGQYQAGCTMRYV